MSSKTRKRIPQKSEDSAKPIAEDEAVGSAAVKDPLVRSPPKPVDQSKVDEYWDLEDDENWVDGQSPGAEKERDEEDIEMTRRRRVLKRDSVEVGVAFAFHLVVMCVYIYIHVYDATIIKRNKGKGFEGIQTYGGRWKYLTYWNLVRCYISLWEGEFLFQCGISLLCSGSSLCIFSFVFSRTSCPGVALSTGS